LEDDELVIPLVNGCKLCCGAWGSQFGGDVTIRDADGNEILHWVATEWEEEPELVMGAIFGAASATKEELLAGRVLEDGCWNYRGGHVV
jgi:hypothetical protein